jgi:hypothetical protein
MKDPEEIDKPIFNTKYFSSDINLKIMMNNFFTDEIIFGDE